MDERINNTKEDLKKNKRKTQVGSLDTKKKEILEKKEKENNQIENTLGNINETKHKYILQEWVDNVKTVIHIDTQRIKLINIGASQCRSQPG